MAANLLKSGLVARTRAGRRLLERSGDRFAEADTGRLFGAAPQRLGGLPT
jgi:hypothetical protein